MLHQFAGSRLARGRELEGLEIGPGSGIAAHWLAPWLGRLTLVECSAPATEFLRRQLAHRTNVDFVTDDLSRPGWSERWQARWRAQGRAQENWGFDWIYALDVFEYVRDPGQALRNLAAVLRGELFLSFPNQAPPRGDGVTWFERRSEFEALLRQSGLRSEIQILRPRFWMRTLYALGHELPLRLLRAGRRQTQAQRYDETWAWRQAQQIGFGKWGLHAAWSTLDLLLRMGGTGWEAQPAPEALLGYQVCVRAVLNQARQRGNANRQEAEAPEPAAA